MHAHCNRQLYHAQLLKHLTSTCSLRFHPSLSLHSVGLFFKVYFIEKLIKIKFIYLFLKF
jgi:hypothetical protein